MMNMDNTKTINELIYLCTRLARNAGKCFSGSGLSYTEMRFIEFVCAREFVSLAECAEKFRISNGAVTQITGKLLAGKYIKKAESGHDKRKTILTVTQKGLNMLNQFKSCSQDLEKFICDEFDNCHPASAFEAVAALTRAVSFFINKKTGMTE